MPYTLIIGRIIQQIVSKISAEIDCNPNFTQKEKMKRKLEDWATVKTATLKEQSITDGSSFKMDLDTLEKDANAAVRYNKSVGKYGEEFFD